MLDNQYVKLIKDTNELKSNYKILNNEINNLSKEKQNLLIDINVEYQEKIKLHKLIETLTNTSLIRMDALVVNSFQLKNATNN